MNSTSASIPYAKKVVWHDPNPNSSENIAYSQDHFKNLLLKRFDKYEEAGAFLQNDNDKWIVVTAGTNGLDFVKLIHSLRSVIAIIVFCGNKKYHEGWAKDYPKIQKVATKIIEVEVAIDEAFDRQIVYATLKLSAQRQTDNKISRALEQVIYGEHHYTEPQSSLLTYHHSSVENNIQFKSISKILLRECDISPNLVLKELIALNPESESYIKEDFEERLPDVLRAILYLYSTDYFYGKFNQIFAAQEYHRLPYTLASCLHEIRRRPDLRVEEGTVLFRGVQNLEHKRYNQKDGIMYWPAFTSTSRSQAVAEAFAGKDGSVFVIQLSTQNPHAHIKLGADWVRFPAEDEVLLFPHFSFRVKEKKVEKGRTWIVLEQEEYNDLFSLDETRFANYWDVVIKQEILPSIEEIFEALNGAMNKLDICNLFHKIQIQEMDEMETLNKKCIIKVLTRDVDQPLSIINEHLVSNIVAQVDPSGIGYSPIFLLNITIIEKAITMHLPFWVNLFRPLIEDFNKRVILKVEGLIEPIQETFESIIYNIIEETKPNWFNVQERIKEEMKRETEGVKLQIQQKIQEYFGKTISEVRK